MLSITEDVENHLYSIFLGQTWKAVIFVGENAAFTSVLLFQTFF